LGDGGKLATTSGRFPAVTVRATDLALGDPLQQPPLIHGPIENLRDVGNLFPTNMIELQDQRIGFATVNAWMAAEVLGNKCTKLCP